VQQFLAKKTFLSSSEWLLAVPYSENQPQGACFATMDDIKSNATAELGRFQKKPSASVSNNGRIDGASVCVRKGPSLEVIR
jgi:hypothetical protein